MKRKFTINAAKRIQASPVDFNKFDDLKNKPQKIEQVLEANREALEDYFMVKGTATVDSINSDLRKIMDEYVGIEGLEDFLGCITNAGLSEERPPVASQVLEHIYFDVLSDEDYVMMELNPGLPEKIIGPSVASGMFMDDVIEELWKNLAVFFAEPTEFIDAMIEMFTDKIFVRQITPENVVDMCQKLIYEYFTVIEDKFSAIFEKATSEFLEKY